jgi:hypothetical protein
MENQDNNQFTQLSDVQPSYSNKPQSTNRLVKILISLLVILVIVIVGLGVYVWQHNKVVDLTKQLNSTKTTIPQDKTTDNVLSYNSQQFTNLIYNQLQSVMPSNYTIINSTSSPTTSDTIAVSVGHEISNTAENVGPGIAATAYNFIVQPQGYTITLYCSVPSSNNNPSCPSTVQTAIEKLVSKEMSGFQYIKNGGYLDGLDGPNPKVDVYENNLIDCYVNYSSFGNGTFLGCSDKSEYPVAYQEVQSLLNATPTTGSGSPQPTTKPQLVFPAPFIGNSQTNGYKYAYMGYGAAEGYFYKEGNIWYYLGSGQFGFNCTDLSSNTSTNIQAMIAFQGQPCTTNNGNSSTVQ